MRVLIEYKAKLTWVTDGNERFREYHSEMCSVKHEIDTDSLETTAFHFEPLGNKEDATSRQDKKESRDGGENKGEGSKD